MEAEINRRLRIIEMFKGKNLVRVHYLTNPSKGYVYYGDNSIKALGIFKKKDSTVKDNSVMVISAVGVGLLFEENDKTIDWLKDNMCELEVEPLTNTDFISKILMEDIREAILFGNYELANRLVEQSKLVSEGKYLEFLELRKLD